MVAPAQIVVGGSGVTWNETTDTDGGEITFSTSRFERRWLVTGTFDVEDLYRTRDDNAPLVTIRNGIAHARRGVKIDPAPGQGNTWLVVASYEFQVESYELSFDTSGATSKALVALNDGDYYNCVTPGDPNDLTPAGQDTVDFGRLVGVDGEKVEGVEVPVSKFDFTVMIRNRFATLPSTYIDTLERLTGRSNDRPLAIVWKGQVLTFGTEELLYQGCPGKMTSEDGFELTLKFSKQRSAAGGAQTSIDFVQPAVGATVTVSMEAASLSNLFSVGDVVYVVGGGHYAVTAISGGDLTIQNLGYANNAAVASTVSAGANVSGDADPPITVGNSSPIRKAGWRYLSVTSEYATVRGRRVLQPSVAVVYKVIPTADLGPIGIFSEVP